MEKHSQARIPVVSRQQNTGTLNSRVNVMRVRDVDGGSPCVDQHDASGL